MKFVILSKVTFNPDPAVFCGHLMFLYMFVFGKYDAINRKGFMFTELPLYMSILSFGIFIISLQEYNFNEIFIVTKNSASFGFLLI